MKLTHPLVEIRRRFGKGWFIGLALLLVVGFASLIFIPPQPDSTVGNPSEKLVVLEPAQEVATLPENSPASPNTTPDPPPQPSAPPTPSSPTRRPGFQIQFTGAIDTSGDATIYELDGDDTPKATVDALHAKGRTVLCYVNVGAWENWRSDADQFPQSVLGNDYVGYPDERWLDIRQIETLAPILGARFETCRSKGFDAIDGDNVDGFEQDSGFPISADDQLRFNRWVAAEAHARGLKAVLKNDGDQAAALVGTYDLVVTESCIDQGNCAAYAPFRSAGKLHLDIEYTDTTVSKDRMCAEAARFGLIAVRKHRLLDAFREGCE